MVWTMTHLSYDLPVRLSDRCAAEQSREWCISPWCIPDIASSWCWYWYHCHNRSINHLFPEPNAHTHTHTRLTALLSGTTQVSRYQKGKTNLDFTGARESEWQWHQLGHMQVCTSLQTDNHASTPPLSFFTGRCPSCRPTNSVKALKARTFQNQKLAENKKNIKKSKLLKKCLENKNAKKKDNSTYNCPKENTNTTPIQYRHAANPMVLAQLQSLDNEYQLSLTEHVSTIDMAWQNFWSPKFRKKFQNEVLLFLVIPKFPFNCKICRRKLSCQ